MQPRAASIGIGGKARVALVALAGPDPASAPGIAPLPPPRVLNSADRRSARQAGQLGNLRPLSGRAAAALHRPRRRSLRRFCPSCAGTAPPARACRGRPRCGVPGSRSVPPRLRQPRARLPFAACGGAGRPPSPGIPIRFRWRVFPWNPLPAFLKFVLLPTLRGAGNRRLSDLFTRKRGFACAGAENSRSFAGPLRAGAQKIFRARTRDAQTLKCPPPADWTTSGGGIPSPPSRRTAGARSGPSPPAAAPRAGLQNSNTGPLRGPCAARRWPPGPALSYRYKNFHFILNYMLLLLTSYYYYYIFH